MIPVIIQQDLPDGSCEDRRVDELIITDELEPSSQYASSPASILTFFLHVNNKLQLPLPKKTKTKPKNNYMLPDSIYLKFLEKAKLETQNQPLLLRAGYSCMGIDLLGWQKYLITIQIC